MPQGDGGKRAAPISASAFSFSLGAATKKSKPATPRQQPSLATRTKPSAPASRGASSPAPRVGKPISSHVLVTPTRRTPKDAVKATAAPLPSPFGLTPKPLHKPLTALDDPASPFRLAKGEQSAETPPRKELQAITAMPRVDALGLSTPELEREEGVGVSPRRHKGAIQHKGSGPPPSVRLSNLVSSANTSLVLFYTSLQQMLYPSTARPARASLSHIRAAPIRLQMTAGGVVPGPTHAATMATCVVMQWPTEPAPATVLVVFQTLPADCPRLGLDPKMIATAVPEKTFEVGVLAPWSETSMPSVEDDQEDAVVLFASRYLVSERE